MSRSDYVWKSRKDGVTEKERNYIAMYGQLVRMVLRKGSGITGFCLSRRRENGITEGERNNSVMLGQVERKWYHRWGEE